MTNLQKQDLLGLLAILVIAVVLGYLTTPQFGITAWTGATASAVYADWSSRRRQRLLLPALEQAAEQHLKTCQTMKASGIPELVEQGLDLERSALELRASVEQARKRLG